MSCIKWLRSVDEADFAVRSITFSTLIFHSKFKFFEFNNSHRKQIIFWVRNMMYVLQTYDLWFIMNIQMQDDIVNALDWYDCEVDDSYHFIINRLITIVIKEVSIEAYVKIRDWVNLSDIISFRSIIWHSHWSRHENRSRERCWLLFLVLIFLLVFHQMFFIIQWLESIRSASHI